MALYDVKIEVEEVRGLCAAGYRKGDSFLLKGFYIEPEGAPGSASMRWSA